MSQYHTPVMQREVTEYIHCVPGGVYVDGTLGGGGHAYEILKNSAPDGILIGIDLDDDALEESKQRLQIFQERAILKKGNFSNIDTILKELNIHHVDGILFDLGVSSHQMDTPDRGFSFSLDAALDMRMDRSGKLNAYDLVNSFPEEELEKIIRNYGEEFMARKIVRAISAKRRISPIRTTAELADIVACVVRNPMKMKRKNIHPATKTFQALRIFINEELLNLDQGINLGMDALKPSGRFVIISFHSLEDRIVKNHFRTWEKGCICPPDFPVCSCQREPKLKVLTKKAVNPGDDEIHSNPRARSAKLRAAVKV
jgi:16S rRNA (cytosine1402-N4)-methyltransferase